MELPGVMWAHSNRNRQSDFYVSIPKPHFMGEIFVVIDDQQRCNTVTTGQLDRKIALALENNNSFAKKLKKNRVQITKTGRDFESADDQKLDSTLLKKETMER